MNKVKTNKTLRHSEYYGMTQIFDEHRRKNHTQIPECIKSNQ
ncbi:hypothetical protein EfmJHP10_28400 [Enterococcus faecium]|nr:hypothetical protein EfmJHP10_28400 [Enterococcus faecium]